MYYNNFGRLFIYQWEQNSEIHRARVIFSMATLILHTSTPSQFTFQPNTIPNPNFISLNLNFNKRSSRSTSSLRATHQDSNPQNPQGYISISLALYLLANLIVRTHSHHQMPRSTIWELKLLFPSWDSTKVSFFLFFFFLSSIL